MIFGLGSGRCGTSSLAHLINSQRDTVCFHEMNPSCMAWTGADQTVHSLLRDFSAILRGGLRAVTVDLVSPARTKPLERLRSLENLTAIGDVASYYLPYVELIIDTAPMARFPCLRRSREETIASFARKLSPKNFARTRNHWVTHPNPLWAPDRNWDKCFPTFPETDSPRLEDYVGQYYDMYYQMAEDLEKRFPDHLRIFELQELGTRYGRSEILQFCLPDLPHEDVDVHLNSSARA